MTPGDHVKDKLAEPFWVVMSEKKGTGKFVASFKYCVFSVVCHLLVRLVFK